MIIKNISSKFLLMMFLFFTSIFLFNFICFAQNNEAYIEQVGEENQATVKQINSNNGGFSPAQFSVTLLEINNANVYVPSEYLQYHQLKSYGSYITQFGNYNTAIAEQENSQQSRNYIRQFGINHFAEVKQFGLNKVASVAQFGDGCSFSVIQSGPVPIPLIVTQTK